MGTVKVNGGGPPGDTHTSICWAFDPDGEVIQYHGVLAELRGCGGVLWWGSGASRSLRNQQASEAGWLFTSRGIVCNTQSTLHPQRTKTESRTTAF